MLESAAQAVIAKLMQRYLAYHFSGRVSNFYNDSLRAYTTFGYLGGASQLLFAEMRADGVDSVASLVFGDVISYGVGELIPINDPHEIRIEFSGQRVEVETGFIPNFTINKDHEFDNSLSGPHPRFGYRWDRVDLRVYENIIMRQRHIAPHPRFKYDLDPSSMLSSEIDRGDWTGIEQAIRAGSRIEAKNTSGSAPLVSAAARGNLDACKLLIALGAHPDSPGSSMRPLTVAHRFNQHSIVDLLLSEGARVNYSGGDQSYYEALEFDREKRLADRHGEKIKRAWNRSFLRMLWDEFDR